MKLWIRSLACLVLLVSPVAFAQDTTIFFENFENGFPAGWQTNGPPSVAWHVAPNAECGAVTSMIAFNKSPFACDYAGGAPIQDASLVTPPIVVNGSPTWQLTFDYILDIDPSGDAVALTVTSALTLIEVVFASTPDLVNDGALHSVVLQAPITGTGTLLPGIFRFHIETDGIGDQGRGWLIDNVRFSSTAPGAVFCSGATAAQCPCANGGGPQRGCASQTGVGVALRGVGAPSVSADTFQLGAIDLPASSPAIWFGGTAQASALFGNGRRCVAGSMVRLGRKSSSTGNAVVPEPGEPRISVLSPVPAGATRYYQVIYRDVAGPCGQAFNLSNGWQVTWTP